MLFRRIWVDDVTRIHLVVPCDQLHHIYIYILCLCRMMSHMISSRISTRIISLCTCHLTSSCASSCDELFFIGSLWWEFFLLCFWQSPAIYFVLQLVI